MQQKHVITHPDQAGRTRSRQNQNYPEKYFRVHVTILFSYELQLLCVWYYRSHPEIVYLKCYSEFIFFKLLIIYFTFYFVFVYIFVYFSNFSGSKNRGSMDPVHERGPWTRSIFCWTRSMDPVHGGSMDQGSMFCTFPVLASEVHSVMEIQHKSVVSVSSWLLQNCRSSRSSTWKMKVSIDYFLVSMKITISEKM